MWTYASIEVVPPANDLISLDLHDVGEAKAQRIIHNRVNYHLTSHLSKKDTMKKMWDALTKLYQSDYQSQNMMLKDKLHSTRMSRERA